MCEWREGDMQLNNLSVMQVIQKSLDIFNKKIKYLVYTCTCVFNQTMDRDIFMTFYSVLSFIFFFSLGGGF